MVLVIILRYQTRLFTDMTFLPFYHSEFTHLTDFEWIALSETPSFIALLA